MKDDHGAQPDRGFDKRSVRNYILQPLLQVKLGLYSVVLAIAFSAAIASIVYYSMGEFVAAIIQLTDVEEDVRLFLTDVWSRTKWWVVAVLGVFVIANLVISIIYTHRLVGPTVAFRRHLQELRKGNYDTRTFLRKGDAFVEVAEELNRLSEALEKSDSKQEGSDKAS